MTEAIGWISSAILVLTVGKQIHKQYKSGSSEGVSKWLFIGQMAANCGFLTYSLLVKNWVFVVTNMFMICNALLGLSIVLHHRRKNKQAGEAQAGGDEAEEDRENQRPQSGQLEAEQA